MEYNLPLKTIYEDFSDIYYEISKELFNSKNHQVDKSVHPDFDLRYTEESHIEHYELLSDAYKNDIKVSSLQLLNNMEIQSFFYRVILNKYWQASYKFREEFFNWVVKEGYNRLPRKYFSFYSYSVISEFENELLKRVDITKYQFIADESIVFNLQFINLSNQNIPNNLYWFSRYLKDYGSTANVRQFYMKIKDMLGQIYSKEAILFELDAKRYLIELLSRN